MPVPRPSRDTLDELNRAFGLRISEPDLQAYLELGKDLVAAAKRVDDLAEALPFQEASPRDRTGGPPSPPDNPHRAWVWKARIEGSPSGPLAGCRVAIKDNTCVAGLPMRNGSALLEGFVPDVDATVVERILDAGGVLLGKAACEDLCFSGGSHTAVTGPVRNPHDPERMAGGSSSGSGALVALGEVDLATGSDQGGSLRIPAAWCGVVGLKPTYGLVPYTGVAPVEVTLDHYGPMAPTVRDVARFLEVLAGPDGLDPRQRDARAPPEGYVSALTGDAEGLRVGLLREGFGWPDRSDPAVDRLVRDAVEDHFGAVGADVGEASVSRHRDGCDLHTLVSTLGAYETLVLGHGFGSNRQDLYLTRYQAAFTEGLATRADRLSPTVKKEILLGRFLHERTQGRLYGKAQNLRPALRAAYDAALRQFDVLALPTVPFQPRPIPPRPSDPARVTRLAARETPNTSPFNLTGHPALSVNAGWIDGLPVGLMLVGRHGDERTLLRAADAFERRTPAPSR